MSMTRLDSEIMDTRDLIERAEELEALAEELREDPAGPASLDAEDTKELAEIAAIEDEVPDYPYGETLIREDYFVDYAQELAEEIGAIGSDNQWPLYCIDWERAADELKVDYTTVEYQGNTYYARA